MKSKAIGILMLLVTVTTVTMLPMVNVASASPATYFFVDPAEVSANDPFLINISVTEAPDTYAWEFTLSWDPDLLELVFIEEGDFLHRWEPNPFPPPDYVPKYETTFAYIPLADANPVGEIMIGCSLIGDVPWASGDGMLVSLGFLVEATGSCVLDLYKTRLWDHIEVGSPASTYYPNQDGFFYNEAFHDIAVTNVEIAAGGSVSITVTVENEGDFSETFDVTVYADVTVYNTTVEWWPDEIVVGDEITVGTETVTDLASGATATSTVTWDTTGVPADTYTISAEAIVSDDDTRDNLFIDGTVTVIGPPPETGTISGTVTDSDTTLAIEGATVSADGYSDTTDASGLYSIEVPPGVYDVTAEMTGYESQTVMGISVSADETVTVDFALTPMVLPDIIIVDDNDGSHRISGTSLPEFELALTAAGYNYYLWDEYSMGHPPLAFLTEFKLVIWTCGDYWEWAVDPIDALTLESYLAQGGNILLEGEDIGYDHYADAFMVNVAHAIMQRDGTGAPGLTVMDPTHPVTFDLPTSFTWLSTPPYDDGVLPTNGGAEVIKYTDTPWTAVTVFQGGASGSVVYHSFPLYCLAQSEGQKLALNSINWLLGIKFEHDLAVSLDAPDFLKLGDSSLLNITVYNRGLSNETDVELQLLINGNPINYTVIPELTSDSSYTLSSLWTPAVEGTYNVTAYAPPIPEEATTVNNKVTKFVTVKRPLIQPAEGQWANYRITLTEKATNTSWVTLLNSTYSRYISPHQMNVTLRMTDPWGGTMTTWLILNVMTREVEAGMWAGLWYPLWIQTNVTTGSFVRILGTTGTVIGSRFVEVGEHLIDSWELQALYGISYIFLFDKVTGVVTGVEGDDPYYHEHWELTATNILKLLPAEALEEMIKTIETWNLRKGAENSLTSKLDDAVHLLDKGNENGAIHKLMDFISQVEAFREKRLTNEQADQLISEAQRIIGLIEG